MHIYHIEDLYILRFRQLVALFQTVEFSSRFEMLRCAVCFLLQKLLSVLLGVGPNVRGFAAPQCTKDNLQDEDGPENVQCQQAREQNEQNARSVRHLERI